MTNRLPHSELSAEPLADSELDLVIDAFETQMEQHGHAAIEDFVPDQHPDKHAIILELLRVDLERQRSRGIENLFGDYLKRFPDTLAKPDARAKLAFDDYVWRCRQGEYLSRDTYRIRFDVSTSDWPTPAQVCAADDGEPRDPTSDDGFPIAGERLLDFEVLVEFGRGAFSRVYLARESTLSQRLVVLKMSRYCWAESDLLAKLQHTNIVPIYSVHRVEGLQIVCMPFWGTCTLADILSEVKNSPDSYSRDWSDSAIISTVANHQNQTVVSAISAHAELGKVEAIRRPESLKPAAQQSTHFVEACIQLMAQVADGLGHAHERGIVHSDLKPSNILMADDGRPMILDFNLAVDVQDVGRSPVGGTIPYMAPEQMASFQQREPKPKVQSDIYSLGVILFELLAKQKPFPFRPGTNEASLDRMVADRRLAPDLKQVQPGISAGLSRVVGKCLAFDPKDRYQSAYQLRNELQRELNHQSLQHVPEPWYERMAKTYRRSPRAVWTAFCALALFVMLVLTWGYVFQADKAKRHEALSSLRDFERDSEWLSSVLSMSKADDRERELAEAKAKEWIAFFDRGNQSTSRYLAPDQRGRLEENLAELAQLQEFSSVDENHGRKVPQGMNETRASDALAVVETLGLMNQKNYSEWARLGNAHVKLGNLDLATECFTGCIALRPDVAFGYFQRGLVNFEQEKYERAQSDLRRYVELRPDSYRGRAKLAVTLLRLSHAKAETPGMVDSALQQIEAAIQLRPDLSTLHLVKAEVLRRLGDEEGARESIERASELPADQGQDYLSKGMAKLRQREFSSALTMFKLAHQVEPTSVEAMKNVAYVLSEHLGDIPNAVTWIDTALEVHPHSSELVSTKAVLLARMGQSDESRRLAKEALEIDREATTLLRVASVYALTKKQMQDVRMAVEYVRQALSTDPAWISYVPQDPDLAAVRDDPRFQTVVRSARTMQQEVK